MAHPVDAKLERRVLHAGDCVVTDRPMALSTLLGSCVAVCLYDPVKRVMGMNHFLLANNRYKKDGSVLVTEAGRYGIHAMELLINGALKAGARRANLRAKAFGGGNVLGTANCDGAGFMCVGAVNVRFVREFLANDKIPLVAADLGGRNGRQIHFDGNDYSVYVRPIQSEQSKHLVEEERFFWRQSLKELEKDHQHPADNLDMW
jgi:chemotaxis protein CheD